MATASDIIAAGAAAAVGAPGPGGQPAPAGYTWVARSGSTPGHWARIDAPPPSVPAEVREHRSDAEAAHIESVLGDAVPSVIWTAADPGPHKPLMDAGATRERIALHDAKVQRYLDSGETDAITAHLRTGTRNGVFEYRLDSVSAIQAKQAGQTPMQWWVAQWMADFAAADIADAAKAAADKAAADKAAAKPVLPALIQQPSASKPVLLLAVLAAGVAYLLMS